MLFAVCSGRRVITRRLTAFNVKIVWCSGRLNGKIVAEATERSEIIFELAFNAVVIFKKFESLKSPKSLKF